MERTYTLLGEEFDLIPNNALGLYAQDPANPLQYIDRVSQLSYRFLIVEKYNNRLVLQQSSIEHGVNPNYLGAIVSNDGSIVYWENNLIV